MIRSFWFVVPFSLLILDIGHIFSYLSAKGTWRYITSWCLEWPLHLSFTLLMYKTSYRFVILVSPLSVICASLFVKNHVFLEEMNLEVFFFSHIPSFQFSVLKINNVPPFSKFWFILWNFENFLMFSDAFLSPGSALFFNLLRLIIRVSTPAEYW